MALEHAISHRANVCWRVIQNNCYVPRLLNSKDLCREKGLRENMEGRCLETSFHLADICTDERMSHIKKVRSTSDYKIAIHLMLLNPNATLQTLHSSWFTNITIATQVNQLVAFIAMYEFLVHES